MKFGFDRRTRGLVWGGLFLGVATVALGAPAAMANDFLGVDIGPVSVGIGPNAPTYYVPPPSTYVAPSVTYAQPSVVYQSPPATYYVAPDYYAAPGTVIVR
jgi:hypothetical protein